MSDLIEKLKQKISEVEAARGPEKCILYDRLADLGQVAWDHWEEILSALETVRGIGEIAKPGWGVEIVPQTDGGWLIFHGELRDDCIKAPTLSAAIEAARKGM